MNAPFRQITERNETYLKVLKEPFFHDTLPSQHELQNKFLFTDPNLAKMLSENNR
jgi:hypothetical protein